MGEIIGIWKVGLACTYGGRITSRHKYQHLSHVPHIANAREQCTRGCTPVLKVCHRTYTSYLPSIIVCYISIYDLHTSSRYQYIFTASSCARYVRKARRHRAQWSSPGDESRLGGDWPIRWVQSPATTQNLLETGHRRTETGDTSVITLRRNVFWHVRTEVYQVRVAVKDWAKGIYQYSFYG